MPSGRKNASTFEELVQSTFKSIKNEDENKVSKKEIMNIADEKFGSLEGLAQQYLFYWKRDA